MVRSLIIFIFALTLFTSCNQKKFIPRSIGTEITDQQLKSAIKKYIAIEKYKVSEAVAIVVNKFIKFDTTHLALSYIDVESLISCYNEPPSAVSFYTDHFILFFDYNFSPYRINLDEWHNLIIKNYPSEYNEFINRKNEKAIIMDDGWQFYHIYYYKNKFIKEEFIPRK